MPFPQDPALAVLRDIEIIFWLTLLLGLPMFALCRRVTSSAAPAEGPADWTKEGNARQQGLDVSHFTWFDLAILPMVLIKFSAVLAGAVYWLVTRVAPTPTEGKAEAAATAAGWTPVMILADLTLNFIIVATIVLAIQWSGRRGITQVFGLDRLSAWPLALWMATGAIIVTPTVILLSNFVPDLLAPFFGEKIEEQAAVENIRKTSGDSPFQFMLIVNAVFFAPLVEEIVFRGYFYGALKQKTSAIFAAFVTAVLFAAVHSNALAFLPLFLLALCLTYFYEASRCLWVPIGIHATFNAVNVALILAGYGEGRGD